MTKIVGVSFGTKNGNNDTICKAVLLAAKEAGCEVEFIRAMDLDIKHCTGCITCVKMLMCGTKNMCIHMDDFDWLAFEMFRADGVVMVDPIFETGASGLFHTIMDRFGPRMDTGNNFISTQIAKGRLAGSPAGRRRGPRPGHHEAHRPSPTSASAAPTGARQSEHQLQAMTPSWKVIDNEWVPWSKTALMDDALIDRATKIGQNLAAADKQIQENCASGKQPYEGVEYQGEKGICPHCNCNDFYMVPGENRAICCVCGLEGELSVDENGVHVTYKDEDLHKAHDIISGKEIHGKDIQENEGKLAGIEKTQAYKDRVLLQGRPSPPPPRALGKSSEVTQGHAGPDRPCAAGAVFCHIASGCSRASWLLHV